MNYDHLSFGFDHPVYPQNFQQDNHYGHSLPQPPTPLNSSPYLSHHYHQSHESPDSHHHHHHESPAGCLDHEIIYEDGMIGPLSDFTDFHEPENVPGNSEIYDLHILPASPEHNDLQYPDFFGNSHAHNDPGFLGFGRHPDQFELTDRPGLPIVPHPTTPSKVEQSDETQDPHISDLYPARSPAFLQYPTPTYAYEGALAAPSTPIGDETPSISTPYAHLIYEALKNAPNNRLVLRDIYAWFEANTDKTQNGGWQNSVRHNLSMNEAFRKVRCQSATDGNKSGYVWVLEPAALRNGISPTTRFRKRKDNKVQKRKSSAYKMAQQKPAAQLQTMKVESQAPLGYGSTAFGSNNGAYTLPTPPMSAFSSDSPLTWTCFPYMGY